MKDLIYYPSLSAGGCAGDFKKNKEVKPGLTCRFYDKEFPEKTNKLKTELANSLALSFPLISSLE